MGAFKDNTSDPRSEDWLDRWIANNESTASW